MIPTHVFILCCSDFGSLKKEDVYENNKLVRRVYIVHFGGTAANLCSHPISSSVIPHYPISKGAFSHSAGVAGESAGRLIMEFGACFHRPLRTCNNLNQPKDPH